jgi:hypothetical protein
MMSVPPFPEVCPSSATLSSMFLISTLEFVHYQCDLYIFLKFCALLCEFLYTLMKSFQWILRSCDRASWQILIIRPTRCTNFSNLFWNENLHVSDSFSVQHQESFTVHTAMLYVIQVRRQLSSSCSKAVYKPVWHTPLLCWQWKTPDDGQRNCPKHVEFHFKINVIS